MKTFSKYHYLLSFLLPAGTLLCLVLGSWYIYLPLLSILLSPMLDLALGRSRMQAHSGGKFFKILLYAHVLLYIALIAVALRVLAHTPLSLAWGVIILTVGVNGVGSVFAAGHELIHSHVAFERRLGLILLLLTNYGHFAIEHLRAHHAFVATDQDPATARRDESLLAFYLRTIPSQYLDVVRSARTNPKVRHAFVIYTLLEFLIYAAILFLFGLNVFFAWLLMSGVSILGVEYANYIRHWGLERAPGEAISPLHSWQSDAIWSRAAFLDLPVHSDHHVSNKPFQELQFFDTNRYLPSGYYATFWIATIPPLWKRLMLRKIAAT